jgi:serine/threonine-protein kinase HipA
MGEQRLIVELYGEQIGTLVRCQGGGAVFQADSTWITNDFKPRLGLAWSLRPQDTGRRSSNMYLPAWFENLLPERDADLRLRAADAIGIHPKKSFTLLARLGMDLPGAVVIKNDAAHSLEDVEPDEHVDAVGLTPESDRSFHFSSLAGMQLKFSVSLRDEKLALPVKGEDGNYIIKLTTGDYPELAAVEYATMQWANAVGFDVPEHRLVRLADVKQLEHLASSEDEWAFLIRRYDRTENGRVHQEDFAQVLELMPEDKYAERGRGQISHNGMARIVLDACGENELLEYVRRLVFVIASANTDAHLKNWSLLHPRAERPRLTPLYDQVCTIAWSRHGWDHETRMPRLSLGLGGSRWFADVTFASFHPMAQRVGMPEKDMDELVSETITRCYACWPNIEAIAPARVRDAMAVHRRKVPLLRQFTHSNA